LLLQPSPPLSLDRPPATTIAATLTDTTIAFVAIAAITTFH
jgi:hypothetical protein